MKVDKLINSYIKSHNLKNTNYMDIDRLIAFSLNKELNDYLIYKKDIILNDQEVKRVQKNLDTFYISKVPLQYILGKQSFFKETYIVTPSVLIPRQDTEILVEEAIKYINLENLKYCLDLCSGSGCIGISISNNSSIEKTDLIDISKDAVKIAEKNIILNNSENKCKCICSDLFDNIKLNTKYDILVSNPPYISKEELILLDEYVKKEPLTALDGGKKGLDIYDKILQKANNYLADNAVILFEIGYNQKSDLISLISKYDYYEYIDCIKDYGNNDRVIVCRFHQR